MPEKRTVGVRPARSAVAGSMRGGSRGVVAGSWGPRLSGPGGQRSPTVAVTAADRGTGA